MFDPLPAVIIHGAIVVLSAMILSAKLKSLHLPVMFGLAIALAVSLLWRELGFGYWLAWKYGLWKPAFEGQIVSSPNADTIQAFAAFWIFPVVLAYGGAWVRAKVS